MATVLTDLGTKYGRWNWNLRFSHSALQRLQMTNGSLTALSQQLLGLVGPEGVKGELPGRTGALLVWAGESWREPKLTIVKVEKRLAAMDPIEQQNLITWAVADYLKACLTLVDADLKKLVPARDDDDE